jgi:hypothetical protein
MAASILARFAKSLMIASFEEMWTVSFFQTWLAVPERETFILQRP